MAKKVVSQEPEYGYRTPNGDEFFPSNTISPRSIPVPFERLETQSGQELAQSRYKGVLKTQGIIEEGNELEFIQRVRTVTLSKVIPLVPHSVDLFDEEDEEAPRPRKVILKGPRPF